MFEEEELYFHRLEQGVWELYSIPSQDDDDDEEEETNPEEEEL